jgi:hypothetical protein
MVGGSRHADYDPEVKDALVAAGEEIMGDSSINELVAERDAAVVDRVSNTPR